MSKTLGTLLPLSSQGSFERAKEFVDWLHKSHQQVWQLLPLHATSWRQSSLFTSPYSSFGIGLFPGFTVAPKTLPDDARFIEDNASWLVDYSLYMSLADHFGSSNWTHWPQEIRHRHIRAMAEWTERLSERITYHSRLQAWVARQWHEVKTYANSKGIEIWGDMPFYLTMNSPLVWAHQQAFDIEESGKLEFISGVIGSSYFPRQVWEHPLYKYRQLEVVKQLWQARLQFAAGIYDCVRLDSAISFYTYNRIHPTNERLDETATGPGNKITGWLFRATRDLGLKMYIENVTAYDTKPLLATANKYKIPGLAVYTLNPERFVPGQFDTQTVYCSSNHDSPPLVEFTGSKKSALQVREFLLDNCSKLIVPIQDWILSSRRINRPGTVAANNWRYRVDVSKLKLP